MGKIDRYLIKKAYVLIDSMEKKGINDETLRKKEWINMNILLLSLHLIMISLLMLFLPWCVFTPIVLYIIITYFILMSGDENKGISNNELLFGIVTVLLMILTIYFSSNFLSYRGEDVIKRRKAQLKRIKRKTKYKKLKFWK